MTLRRVLETVEKRKRAYRKETRTAQTISVRYGLVHVGVCFTLFNVQSTPARVIIHVVRDIVCR